MSFSEDDVRAICSQLLNANADQIEIPGGAYRESVRVLFSGQTLIVTRRKQVRRARLESGVLRVLNQLNQPVPHLIAYCDNWLIQQDVGELRLSQKLNTENRQQSLKLLEAALASLHSIHEAASGSDPLKSLVILGQKPHWLDTFVRSAARLGSEIDHPAPSLDYDKLAQLLYIENPCFIKWDARPGNAIVRGDGRVFWIDWEHCGQRHPLDDVAWLLADEYTPRLDEVDDILIPKVLSSFANGFSPEKANEYFHVYATLHSCIRLTLILHHQAKGGWWDFERCLQFDKVGVVQNLALQLGRRASRWAQSSDLTSCLTPWFDELITKVSNFPKPV